MPRTKGFRVDIEELDLKLILDNIRQHGWDISKKEYMRGIFYTNILILNELTDIKELLKKKEKKEQ
jgi:hypothetical protein